MATLTETIRVLFEGDASDLTSEGRRATGALRGVGQSAATADRKLEGLKRTAQGVGGRVGELAGRAESLGQGLKALGVAGGLAAVAAVGVGVAIVGAVKATQLAVAVTGELVASYERAADAGLAFGGAAQDLDRMRSATEGVKAAGGLLVADVLTYWTPAITTFADVAITGTLELHDLWVDIIGVSSGLTDNLRSLVRLGLLPYAQVLQGIAQGHIALNRLIGVETPKAVIDMANRFDDFDGMIVGALVPSLESLAEKYGFNIDRGRQLTRGLLDQAGAATKAADAITAAAAAQDIGLSVEKKRLLAAGQAAKKVLDTADATAATDAATQDYTGSLGALSSLIGNMPGLFAENSRAAFAATKASALGQAIINTALAVTSTLVNPIQAALVGAAGAAQIATIAAQKPPSFDIGGVVQGGPRMPGGTPGQRLAQVEDGEVILSRRQQDALGGGGAPSVSVYIGGREIKRTIVRSGAVDGYQKRRGLGQRRFVGA